MPVKFNGISLIHIEKTIETRRKRRRRIKTVDKIELKSSVAHKLDDVRFISLSTNFTIRQKQQQKKCVANLSVHERYIVTFDFLFILFILFEN